MKRLFILLVLFSTLVLSTSAQNVIVDEFGDPIYTQYEDSSALNTDVRPTQKHEKFRDRWTFGVKGGLSYFQFDSIQRSPQTGEEGVHYGFFSDLSHEFSLYTEYAFDYGLGIGMYVGNYSYNRYQVYGSSVEFGAYSHFNLMEILSWRKSPAIARRLHIFWDLGIGAAWLWQNNQIKFHVSSDSVTWNSAAVIRTALQIEFMVRPNWGIFIEGEYHGYGRPNKGYDWINHAKPWINAGMLSGGLRYYFDTREKEPNPLLDENELPIRKPRKPREKRPRAPKNAVYVNLDLTPEVIEAARANEGQVAVQVTPLPQSKELDGALQVLEEQGVGTALINSVPFSNDQLTPESMQILDKIAGSLLANPNWTSVEILYVSNGQATGRAAAIANYLRGKGVKNLTVKGRDASAEVDSSDMIITVR